MAAASLFADLLRQARPRNPIVTILRAFPLSLRQLSRPLSSDLANSQGLAVEEESAAPVDDLRSRIFRLRFPKRSAIDALDRWVGEGRTVTASELREITKVLRKSKRYKHALEISEWMKVHQKSELSDKDYAMRIDLLTKVFGLIAAEEFFEGLPSSAKSYEACTALLHSYAAKKQIEKAENLFDRIKELNLSSSVFAYNEMMALYISVGQLDKVTVVVDELKRQKISPDLFTYNLWISSCAASFDIISVRRILDEMAQEPRSDKQWIAYMRLTDIYLIAGQLESSQSSLSEVDKQISQREWITYDFLIILHAGLGNIQMLNDIWKSMKMTKQKMTSRNYICVIGSYLMVEQFKEAGEVIDEWKKSKGQEFHISDLNRLFEALKKAGLSDKAEKFHELMLQKDYELTSDS
ncbi:pentatricopeptide repeat-containing protein At5g09450, mitochondrial isoform X2 [Curcuma longa]|uniref:pentatricopeptide repeat-containing protein At5g09450, mitochondrial isoform X2 n=1 Tax=Curcuma longa TaxID=136217 RepID=UPI003D9EE6F6